MYIPYFWNTLYPIFTLQPVTWNPPFCQNQQERSKLKNKIYGSLIAEKILIILYSWNSLYPIFELQPLIWISSFGHNLQEKSMLKN